MIIVDWMSYRSYGLFLLLPLLVSILIWGDRRKNDQYDPFDRFTQKM